MGAAISDMGSSPLLDALNGLIECPEVADMSDIEFFPKLEFMIECHEFHAHEIPELPELKSSSNARPVEEEDKTNSATAAYLDQLSRRIRGLDWPSTHNIPLIAGRNMRDDLCGGKVLTN